MTLARRVDELPHPLEVALAAQRCPRLAFLGEHSVEHHLGGDRCVIHAWHPQRRIALHSRTADHCVFDCRRERVADVQRPRDVWRRLGDHEWLARPVGPMPLPSGRKDVGFQPTLVDARLDVTRPVRGRHVVLSYWTASCRRPPRHVGRHRRPPETKRPRSSSGRTGSWYHLLVSASGRTAVIPRAVLRTLSCARYRAHPRDSRTTFAPSYLIRLSAAAGFSARAGAALLLPVTAVSADLSKRANDSTRSELRRRRRGVRSRVMCFDLDSRPPIPPLPAQQSTAS